VPVPTITQHSASSLLLTMCLLTPLLTAQMPIRAVAPAHSPSTGNRFFSPGVDTGDYLYVSGQGPRRADGTTPTGFSAKFLQAL